MNTRHSQGHPHLAGFLLVKLWAVSDSGSTSGLQPESRGSIPLLSTICSLKIEYRKQSHDVVCMIPSESQNPVLGYIPRHFLDVELRGRASACHAEGRDFEIRHVRQCFKMSM